MEAGISDVYWPGGLVAGQLGSRKAQGAGAGPFGAMSLLATPTELPGSRILQGSVEAVTYFTFYRYAFQCFQ